VAAISFPFFSRPLKIILYFALANERAMPRPIPLENRTTTKRA